VFRSGNMIDSKGEAVLCAALSHIEDLDFDV
jgi:hypothetical protein